ncbi:MAG TPA: hypothetical protein VIY73_28950, partial [Polyangiaceae bacterium]
MLRVIAGAIAATVCLATKVAWAGGGAATDDYEDVRTNAPVDVHALADVYAQHVLAPGGAPEYRAFDDHADRPALNLLR